MVQLRNNAEGGVVGQPVTSGGGGDEFTAANPSVVFTDAHVAHGERALATAAAGVSGDSVVRWAIGGRAVAIRFYMWLTDAVPSDTGFIRLSQNPDSKIASVYLNGNSAMRVADGASSNVWTAGAAFPLNQWVRVELYATQGSAAANGTLQVVYYLGDSETPVADSGVMTGRTLGGAGVGLTQVRIGKDTSAARPQMFMDELAVDTGADAVGLIGPVPAPRFSSRLGVAKVPVDRRMWMGGGYVQV